MTFNEPMVDGVQTKVNSTAAVVVFPTKPLITTWRCQAGLSRLIGFKSGDGIVRLYPQALAMQHQLSQLINATESVPYVSIDDSTTTAITNATAAPQTPTSQNSSIIFNGFYESTKFNSEDDFYAKFQNSTKYKIATDMLKHATTPLSFGLLKKGLDFQDIVVNNTANDQLFYLETSINPYLPGSSVSHVSQALYLKSVEFLMTFQETPGKTLKDAIKDGVSYVGGAI
ncbi:9771_t:CDS:2 [Entrophospora sp. SA101]|nr:9771_t:CDS:2 [Entrophospora sp. SA101]